MPSSRYRRAYITYIDVLGFRSLIRESEKSPSRIKDIRGILRTLREQSKQLTLKSPDKRRRTRHVFRAVGFSDLTVRIVDLASRDRQIDYVVYFLAEAECLAYMQCRLACRGKGRRPLLIRGGMTFGALDSKTTARSNDFLFGPALVRAYELESRTAIFPRIVVDRKILNLLTPFNRSAVLGSNLVRQSDDGVYFVNYLFKCRESKGGHRGDPSLLEHKVMIETELNRLSIAGADETVLQKYLWLANYHNIAVRQMVSGLARNRLYISDELLRSI